MLSILKDKKLYINLLLAGVILVLLFVGWLKYLDYYTLHDKYIQVRAFKELIVK